MDVLRIDWNTYFIMLAALNAICYIITPSQNGASLYRDENKKLKFGITSGLSFLFSIISQKIDNSENNKWLNIWCCISYIFDKMLILFVLLGWILCVI